MSKSITLSILALAAVFLPVLAWQDVPKTERGLDVTRAVTCLEIKDREPVNIDTVFSSQAEQIYCYTMLEGGSEPTEIEHVWLHDGEEKARVKLPVRGNPWRTWSSKKLLPSWTGDWKVEIRDASGTVLKTVEFRVTKGESGAPPSGSETQEQGEPKSE